MRQWRRRSAVVPPFPEHDLVQRLSYRPPRALQTRLGRPLVWPAEAQPSQRLDAGRESDQRCQLVGSEQGHPSNADTLCSSGEPQVLNGAGARPEVRVDEGGPTEDAFGRRTPIATDDDANRSLAQTVQLQIEHLPTGALSKLGRLTVPLPVGEHGGPFARCGVSHHDESPGLRVPHRWRSVSCAEHTFHHVDRDGVWPEAPDVAAAVQYGVEGPPLLFVEGPRPGLITSLAGRGRVTDEWHRTFPGHARPPETRGRDGRWGEWSGESPARPPRRSPTA